jgi:25S rRNA (uracil2843-N3)-methyltransferase
MVRPKARDKARERFSRKGSQVSFNHRSDDTDFASQTAIEQARQQKVLDLFQSTFLSKYEAQFEENVQTVKKHLYHRDFEAAFGTQSLRAAYTCRWSAARAPAYMRVFQELLIPLLTSSQVSLQQPLVQPTTEASLESDILNIVCLGGGGGAEVAAFVGLQSMMPPESSKTHVTVVDVADWSEIVSDLYNASIATPVLSKYASAAAQAEALPLTSQDALTVGFTKANVLEESSSVVELCLNAKVVTLMFTLNELYAFSKAKTTRFLLDLTQALAQSSILFVVDSPGSYSTVDFGQGSENSSQDPPRSHSMQMLLDLTLLGRPGEPNLKWKKINEEKSKWYRQLPDLKYRVALENMRCQIHVYQRT